MVEEREGAGWELWRRIMRSVEDVDYEGRKLSGQVADSAEI